MALTVTFDLQTEPDNIVGSKRNRHATIVPDSNYPVGGEAISASSFGLVVLDRIIFDGPFVDPDTRDNAVIPFYDKTNGLLLFFWSNSDAADGPLQEVADTTDLSAYTGRVIAVGY